MTKLVSEEYPELMHYTTVAGLAGIVTSGRLWATHASFLNDREEMTHFFDKRLQEIAETELRRLTELLKQKKGFSSKPAMDEELEKALKEEAVRIVEILRRVTLSFNQPYIFSMSGTHDPRIQQNGLLSQWRGYGGDGGYSIIFDTKKLESLLTKEAKSYQYQLFQWADVFYYGLEPISQPSTEDVVKMEEKVSLGVSKMAQGENVEIVEGFYEAISSLSCLYKHWGFQEEHEVRVVAITVDQDIAKRAKETGEISPLKTIKTFPRGGMPVPYIELCANQGSDVQVNRLPIKRVIVGPHRESELRSIAVKKLLLANDYDCDVVCSEIPYVGRS